MNTEHSQHENVRVGLLGAAERQMSDSPRHVAGLQKRPWRDAQPARSQAAAPMTASLRVTCPQKEPTLTAGRTLRSCEARYSLHFFQFHGN